MRSFTSTTTVFLLNVLLGHGALARPSLERRNALGTATVDLANRQGTPQHLASGFIYGIPDTPNQIPDHFYSDIDFKYTRAGGSQLPAPARGWVHGVDEFNVSLYQTKKHQTNYAYRTALRPP
jgi:hypothetical protein